MEIDVREEGKVRILSCQGRLDAQVSGVVKDQIKQHIDEGSTCLILDLKGVEFLDSSGLGALVASLRKIKEKHLQ